MDSAQSLTDRAPSTRIIREDNGHAHMDTGVASWCFDGVNKCHGVLLQQNVL